jgi:zinc protease
MGVRNLLAAVALAAPMAAPASTEWTVTETTLDNGFHVIVKEDHRAPVVVSQLWYHVGASDEHRGITGISHFLEHMMFKGTEKLAPNEFSEIIAREGGQQNAFTGRDYTGYYEALASDRLEVALRLEADRMQNLRIPPEEVDRERQVILEERRLRVEDDPLSAFFEEFNAVTYPASPYSHPIIGWPGDIRSIDREDLMRWYERWYVPANATLVVAGDVQPEAVFDLAREHFGDLPQSEVPERPRHPGLTEPGMRRLVASDQRATVPNLVLTYDVPSAATAEDPADVFALSVAAAILDGGDGARLPQRLVRDRRLAVGVSAGYSEVARYDTRFMLNAVPAEGVSLDELESALRAEVRALAEGPISEAELERARNQLLADFLFAMDSTFYQAMQIGMLETIGVGWDWLQRYEQGIRSVTAEDVREVAQRYFVEDRLSVGRLLPAGNEAAEEGDA